MDFDDRLASSRCCRQLRTESLRFYYGFNPSVLLVASDDNGKASKWLSTHFQQTM